MQSAELSPKVLRQLAAAEGYLDLGMPQHALDELAAVTDPGKLEAPLHYLRGEALKAQERYGEAIAPLQKAAQLIPAPHNKVAWLSLSECFRHRGQIDLADLAETFANSQQSVNITPVLNITINITADEADELDLDDVDEEPELPEFDVSDED